MSPLLGAYNTPLWLGDLDIRKNFWNYRIHSYMSVNEKHISGVFLFNGDELIRERLIDYSTQWTVTKKTEEKWFRPFLILDRKSLEHSALTSIGCCKNKCIYLFVANTFENRFWGCFSLTLKGASRELRSSWFATDSEPQKHGKYRMKIERYGPIVFNNIPLFPSYYCNTSLCFECYSIV